MYVKKHVKEEQQLGENKVKIILFWNEWDPYMGHQPLVDSLCPVTSCLFSSDRSLLNLSHVVLFSLHNGTENSPPDFRQAHQRFVFLVKNTLSQSNDFISISTNNSRTRFDFYNWTMTYRRDSDILLRQSFGTFKPLEKSVITSNHKATRIKMLSSSRLMKRPSKQAKAVSRIGSKNKLVAWFPSRCNTSVNREEYVRQLSAFIPVDIYGDCGNLSCHNDCFHNGFEMLRAGYKFYLSFEEHWCPDYVTAEFYKALDFDTVPIVLGGADYDSLAPPNSFINLMDFPTVKDLADYLLLLNRTDELYSKYFDWKRHNQIDLSPMDGWCDLCRMAHDVDLPPKIYSDIQHWWFDDGQCQA